MVWCATLSHSNSLYARSCHLLYAPALASMAPGHMIYTFDCLIYNDFLKIKMILNFTTKKLCSIIHLVLLTSEP